MEEHAGAVNSVAFNHNGTLLASGSNIIKLWNLETKTEIATLKGHENYVNSVAFNQNGTLLASGSKDDTIKLWNLETKTEIATLKGHTDSV